MIWWGMERRERGVERERLGSSLCRAAALGGAEGRRDGEKTFLSAGCMGRCVTCVKVANIVVELTSRRVALLDALRISRPGQICAK